MADVGSSTSSDPNNGSKSEPLPGLSGQATRQPPLIETVRSFVGSLSGLVTTIGGLAGVLAATGAYFIDDKQAKLVAGVLAVTIVAISTAIVALQARVGRRRRSPDAPGQEILNGPRPLERGPLPFRQGDANRVFDMISSVDFRFGLLVGTFGCGKTSLIRAELLPRLAKAGIPSVYVAAPGPDPISATRAAIWSDGNGDPAAQSNADLCTQLRKIAEDSKKRVIVIYDQFEDFSLARGEGGRKAFKDWLQTCVNDPAFKVGFLFAAREDVVRHLDELGPSIAEALSAGNRYELRDFSPQDAEGILRIAVDRGEARFTSDLIIEIVRDLTDQSVVSPALLQIVSTRLRDRDVSSVRGYKRTHKALGVLEGYLRDQLDDAADTTAARVILQRLTETGRCTRTDILRAIDDARPAQQEARQRRVSLVLTQLTKARLVLQMDHLVYSLAYPILRDPATRAIQAMVAEADPKTQRAIELLESYVARSRLSDGVRISARDLVTIRNCSVAYRRLQDHAPELLRKSERTIFMHRLAAGGVFAVVAVPVLAYLTGVLAPRSAWEETTRFALTDPSVGSDASPTAIAFHPGSKELVMASNGPSGGLFSLTFWDGDLSVTNKLLKTEPQEVPGTSGTTFTALAFDQRGATIASGEPDGRIEIWNRMSGTWTPSTINVGEIRQPASTCQKRGIMFLAYSTTGDRLVSAATCGFLQVWDARRWEPLASQTLPFSVAPNFVRMSPDGARVAVVRQHEGLEDADAIYVSTVKQGQFQEDYGGPLKLGSAKILGLGFDEANRLIVAVSDDSRFELWVYEQDPSAPAGVDAIAGVVPDPSSRTIISRDARIVGVTDASHALTMWDRASRELSSLASIGSTDAILSPNGTALVAPTQVSDYSLYTKGFRWLRLQSVSST